MTSFFRYGGVLTLGAVLSAPAALAAQIDVMAIGDSITWGFDGSSTSGGWRTGLQTNLQNLGSSNTFNFIGIKGDGNTGTVTGENTAVLQTDDSVGPLHEGYSGWVIDALGPAGSTSYSDPDGSSTDPDDIFYDSGQRSGIANHIRTGPEAITPNTAGTIDPGNLNGNFSDPAGVVMLSIGTNDVVTYTGFGDESPYTSISEMISVLGSLIDTIAGVLPASSKLLVSNLTPLNGDPFDSDSNGQTGNDDINAFNSLLLSELFGGAFNTDDYASHESLSNVFLLDANSALTDPANDLLSDNVHPTAQGYTKLADFYTDSFVALGLTVPEPGTAVLMVLGGALLLGRRRRAA